MATIGSRNFNLIEDKYLTLANEEFVRPLSIGNNWSKLRLGAMLAITPDGTNNLPSCALLLGVCSAANPFSGTTGYGAGNTRNYVGLDIVPDGAGGSGPGLFTYYATGGNPYFSATYTTARRRVATTDTFAATAMNHAVATNTGTIQRRTPIYVEITKGSPNYTLKLYTATSVQAQADFAPADFLNGLEQSGTPALGGVTLSASSAITIACDETAGSFDTVSLFWNRASFALEVYILAAFRMA
jgi:hypothetical protein